MFMAARFQLFTRRMATVEWRLVSANNWELGRCALPRSDDRACLDEIASLQQRIGAGVDELGAELRGGWRWRLVLEGEVAAVSSRSFLRRTDCESTLRQFRALAVTAPVVPTVRIFR